MVLSTYYRNLCKCDECWKAHQYRRAADYYEYFIQLTLSLLSSKVYSPNLSKSDCMSVAVRICSIITFHLSKLWKVKFSILCDVIFLVRLEENFDIDHSQEWKGLNYCCYRDSVLYGCAIIWSNTYGISAPWSPLAANTAFCPSYSLTPGPSCSNPDQPNPRLTFLPIFFSIRDTKMLMCQPLGLDGRSWFVFV